MLAYRCRKVCLFKCQFLHHPHGKRKKHSDFHKMHIESELEEQVKRDIRANNAIIKDKTTRYTDWLWAIVVRGPIILAMTKIWKSNPGACDPNKSDTESMQLHSNWMACLHLSDWMFFAGKKVTVCTCSKVESASGNLIITHNIFQSLVTAPYGTVFISN